MEVYTEEPFKLSLKMDSRYAGIFQLPISTRKCYRSSMNVGTHRYLIVSATVVSACAVAVRLP